MPDALRPEPTSRRSDAAGTGPLGNRSPGPIELSRLLPGPGGGTVPGMGRGGNESRAVTPAALGRFVTRSRRGRRAAAGILVSVVVLALIISVLNWLLQLPEWVGYVCLALLVAVAVPVLLRMAEAEDRPPSG